MKYMFGRCVNQTGHYDKEDRELISSATIPMDMCERWSRQMQTEYRDLPEEEKKSEVQ